MTDDMKVVRIVFNEGIVYASEGMSSNPLEYAPKGTLQENAALRKLVKEMLPLIRYLGSIPPEILPFKTREYRAAALDILTRSEVIRINENLEDK